MPLTKSTVAAIDQRAKDDPDFAAAVDAELQGMRIAQELVALRNASGLSQRQLITPSACFDAPGPLSVD